MKSIIFAGVLTLTFLSLETWVQGDTHETLVRRSLSGKPYYVRIEQDLEDSRDVFDTYVQLVFEFTTPNWSRPINLIGYTCNGDDYDNDGWSCPVLWYWLTEIRDKLQEEIYIDSMKVVDQSRISSDFKCGSSFNSKVFSGMYLNDTSKTEFFNFLQINCNPNQTKIFPKSDKFIASGIDAPYRTMREKFFSEYYSLQIPVNRSNDAMYLNARYNYYSSGLFEYWIESRRWSEALQECKAKAIPNTLIPSQDFASILQEVQANVSLHGLELSIGLDRLSWYYKNLFTADCAFTSDSLIVALQIPLKFYNRTLKAVRYLPVPYYNDIGQVCFLDLPKTTQISTSDRRVASVDEIQCHFTNGFCKLTDPLDFGLEYKSCPETLMLEEDDSGICQIQCLEPSRIKLPSITKVDDDRVMVFGSNLSKNVVKIVCPEFQKMEPIDSMQSPVEVTLPCGCEIHQNEKVIFKPKAKCGAEVHVIKI